MVDAFTALVASASEAKRDNDSESTNGQEDAGVSSGSRANSPRRDRDLSPGERERLEKKRDARQRWKILCIVRTADVASDETARQEKIRERVDEWLTSFVSKMRDGGPNQADTSELDFSSSSSSSTSEMSTSLFKTPLDDDVRQSRSRDQHHWESAQRSRIRARADHEREKEKRLILEGKLRMSKKHLDDPVLRVHYNLLQIQRRANSSVSPNRRRKRSSSPKQRKKRIKFKWKKAARSVHNLGYSFPAAAESRVCNGDHEEAAHHDETDTVIAQLLYDERADALESSSSAATTTTADSSSRLDASDAEASNNNPVFDAFDKAQGVDDLFRIAEIWVNPLDFVIDEEAGDSSS